MNNWPKWVNTQNHTGSQYPYYIDVNMKPSTFEFNMNEIIKKVSTENRVLEISSVIEILHKGYIFGDKTLIKGVKRTPWLAAINEEEKWEYFKIFDHGHKIESPLQSAKKIKELLYRELLSYIGTNKRVGILLSGGLDSRIIAGILREVEINKDFCGQVVVYNWGKKDSRDVIYAKKIASLFEWEYVHFELSSEVLKENFYHSLSLGAEISPLHLHAMSKVRDDKSTDIVLAGTFGDSLGRGLYSGSHFSSLKNLGNVKMNKLSLLKESVVADYKHEVQTNYFNYERNLSKEKLEYQLREVEQNAHYLRRLLSTAMSIISQRKPIYQLFTSPEIVNYVWSLDKSVRNDDIYRLILKELPSGIGQIPYAKTGLSFIDSLNQEVDKYSKTHHNYSIWLKQDLKDFIDVHLDFELLNELGIFNIKSLENLYKIWPEVSGPSSKKIDDTIAWMTTLCMFIKKNNIQSEKTYKTNYQDRLNHISLLPKIKAYEIVRSIKN